MLLYNLNITFGTDKRITTSQGAFKKRCRGKGFWIVDSAKQCDKVCKDTTECKDVTNYADHCKYRFSDLESAKQAWQQQ